MAEILSQEEVDALLQGIIEGEVETEGAPAPSEEEVTRFDFRQQERLLLERMENLGIVLDRFSKNVRSSLSDLLHKAVEVDLSGRKALLFSDFIKGIPVPTGLAILKVEPVKGAGLMVLEARLVFSFVELLFGGPKVEGTKVEGRDFTPIEMRVIKRVVGILLEDLRKAWEALYPLRFELEKVELSPQLATVVPQDEAVLTVGFTVELEDPVGAITLCLPSSVLKPVREALGRGEREKPAEDPRWRRALQEALMRVPVTVGVELGRIEMPPRKLIEMKEGDLLRLPTGVEDELVVKVQDLPLFKGTPGLSRGQRAVKITSALG
ncbi:MAG TPA: flagellar motor switch protein FliM [Deltaproteobacteria bacterium]|nr:flagellar motor switch protein FliM [Deltaproteobacteria bacterium]